MPLPDRPVDAAEIATAWGQTIHDYSLAPAGCECSGGAVTMAAAAANTILPIDVADDDPGGYVDTTNNRILFPADSEGLYLIRPYLLSVDGDTDDETLAEVLFNGGILGRCGPVENLGATNAPVSGVLFARATPGDVIQIRARQVGTGTRADVHIESLIIVRLGFELGAPTS